jgi:hypothetical protein
MLDALWDEEIGYVGAGLDRAEAHAPLVIEVTGARFDFLGYDDVSSPYYGATENTPGTAVASEEAVQMQTGFLNGRLASVRFPPIQIEDLHQPRFVDRPTGRPSLDRMLSISEL